MNSDRSGVVGIDVGRNGVEVAIGQSVVDVVVDAGRFAAELAQPLGPDHHRRLFALPVRRRRRIGQSVEVALASALRVQRQHEPLRTSAEQRRVVRVILRVLIPYQSMIYL